MKRVKKSILQDRITLLEQIFKTNSILLSAKNMGIGYRHACDIVDNMNNLSPNLLVLKIDETRVELTQEAHKLLESYYVIKSAYEQFLSTFESECQQYDGYILGFENISFELSARNRLLGKIVNIEIDDLSLKVTVEVKNMRFVVDIIQRSFEYMRLRLDDMIVMIIKASNIKIFRDRPLSEENLFEAKIVGVINGNQNQEVIVEFENGVKLNSFVQVGGDYKINESVFVWFYRFDVIVGV